MLQHVVVVVLHQLMSCAGCGQWWRSSHSSLISSQLVCSLLVLIMSYRNRQVQRYDDNRYDYLHYLHMNVSMESDLLGL